MGDLFAAWFVEQAVRALKQNDGLAALLFVALAAGCVGAGSQPRKQLR